MTTLNNMQWTASFPWVQRENGLHMDFPITYTRYFCSIFPLKEEQVGNYSSFSPDSPGSMIRSRSASKKTHILGLTAACRQWAWSRLALHISAVDEKSDGHR